MTNQITKIFIHPTINSPLAGFYRTAAAMPELMAALRALPGYDQAVATINALTPALEEVNRAPLSIEDTRARLAGDALTQAENGAVSVSELMAAAATIDRDDRTRGEMLRALSAAALAAVERLDIIVSRDADQIRSTLDGRLQTVLEQVRAHKGTPTSAQQAIAQRKVKQYEEGQNLIGDYEAIRRAQRRLDRQFLGDLPADYSLASMMGKPFAVFPQGAAGFGAWAVGDYLRDEDGNQKLLAAPWPDLGANSDNYFDQLLWLATTPEAEPWVPTETQLDVAIRHLEDARQAHYTAKNQGRLQEVSSARPTSRLR